MAHRLAFALALAVAPALLTVAGCTGTGSNPGAADGSAMIPDGQSSAAPDASGSAECVAAGGQCVPGGGGPCTLVGPEGACDPDQVEGAFCCAASPDAICIQASSYDQSCTSDRDCVGISSNASCLLCGFNCPNAAINVSAPGSIPVGYGQHHRQTLQLTNGLYRRLHDSIRSVLRRWHVSDGRPVPRARIVSDLRARRGVLDDGDLRRRHRGLHVELPVPGREMAGTLPGGLAPDRQLLHARGRGMRLPDVYERMRGRQLRLQRRNVDLRAHVRHRRCLGRRGRGRCGGRARSGCRRGVGTVRRYGFPQLASELIEPRIGASGGHRGIAARRRRLGRGRPR